MTEDIEKEESGSSYSWKRPSLLKEKHNDMEMNGVDDDLPLFANEENKQLHLSIKVKESRLEELKNTIQELEERCGVMKEHFKNVQQEVVHTKSLLEAKTKEKISEKHIMQLAQREWERGQQERRKMDAESMDIVEKLSLLQNSLFKGNEKMDKFKMEMNWNQEELEQWAVAAKQKEDDNLALERYTRVDEAKIKEKTLLIEKMTRLAMAKKRELEDELTETHAKQIELDKAADEFKNLHKERQHLVVQWQESLDAMKKRDQEIDLAGQTFHALKQGNEALKVVLNEHKHRLMLQQQDNDQVRVKIDLVERNLAKRRQELQFASSNLQEFKDEVEIVKTELNSAAIELQRKRNHISLLYQELDEQKIELSQGRTRYQSIKKLLESNKDSTMDVESLAKIAQQDLTKKEDELKKAELEISLIKENLFKSNQELFNKRQEEANLLAEISGAQAAERNIHTKVKQLDQSAMRQKELIYNGEFQIQQLERKVSRASGQRSADETKALNAEIAVLQEELNKAKALYTMLDTQCKKLQDEYRKQQRSYATCLKNKTQLESRIAELELENESVAFSLKNHLKEKEEILVQRDVKKLELKRLKDTLNAKADDVFSMENRKYQLKMSMEERKKEIVQLRDVQKAQIRAAEEERHRILTDLIERKNKVEKLKAKFETLVKLSSTGTDGEKSQAYYMIQAAQRREELQREGDELDDKIRVAEKELKALTSTLEHLSVRNSDFRKSFQRIDASSSEAQVVNQLEEQVKQTQERIFKKKKELHQLNTDLEEEQRQLSELQNQTTQSHQHCDQLQKAYDQVLCEKSDQEEKIQRTQKRLNALIREHRSTTGRAQTSEETLEEIAYSTYSTKETINTTLYTLGQLAREFPEINDLLEQALQQHQLQIPNKPPSRNIWTKSNSKNLSQVSPSERPLTASSTTSDKSMDSMSSMRSWGSHKSSGIAIHQIQFPM